MGENKGDRFRLPVFLWPVVNLLTSRNTIQWSIKVVSPIDRVLIPATRGWLSTAPGQQFAVIETVGAKSGKKRRTPLLYMRDGQNMVVVASYGGGGRHPAWYYNLRASPSVRLWSRRARGRYRAQVAEGSERERLWTAVTRFYPGYAKYQTYTDRVLPVVVLTPES